MDTTELDVDIDWSEAKITVVERRGIMIGRLWGMEVATPTDMIDLIARAVDETKAERVNMDSTGLSWGLYHALNVRHPEVAFVPKAGPVSVVAPTVPA